MNTKLKILYMTNGIFVISGALLGPLYAIFVDSFSVSAFTISLTWAAMLFASLITYYLISIYIKDKQSTNINYVVAGYLISATAWFLFSFSTEIYQIFLIQMVLGVGLAIGGPSWNSLVAKHLDKSKQVHDYAEWSMLAKIINIIAVLFGGIVISFFGFESLFLLMSLVGLFAALSLLSYKSKVLNANNK